MTHSFQTPTGGNIMQDLTNRGPQPDHATIHPFSGPLAPEERQVTHDGYIWPRARGDMTQPGPIIDRMVEDMQALLKEQGEEALITYSDLVALGWTMKQTRSYGPLAVTKIDPSLAENYIGETV